MFLILYVLATVFISVYLGSHAAAAFGLSGKGKAVLSAASLFLSNVWLISFGIQFVLKKAAPGLEGVANAAQTYVGFALYLFLFYLFFDAARWAGVSFQNRVLEFGIAAGAAGVLTLYGLVNVFFLMKAVSYEIAVDKKNVDVSLVFLSDTHIGNLGMTPSKMRKAVAVINGLKPDAVVLGGDIIERTPDAFLKGGYPEIFRSINAPVYAVTGNHEYYGRALEANLAAMKEAGIRVLYDEAALLAEKNVYLAGRSDVAGAFETNRPRPPLAGIMKGMDGTKAVVVADHSPYAGEIREAAEMKADLQLSGHTHRGQLFPVNFIVGRIYPNAYGHKKVDGIDTVVSSGLGVWGPPLRTSGSPEIVFVRLRSKQAVP